MAHGPPAPSLAAEVAISVVFYIAHLHPGFA
jgi:hypothetical protein